MDKKTEIFLNQLAQGIRPLKEGDIWFSTLMEDVQRDVLQTLVVFAIQAGAVGVDAESAIRASSLLSTYTPCVLLMKAAELDPKGGGELRQRLAQILNLPATERRKSFKLLVSLLGIADKRRRAKCGLPERHWWHRDLTDDTVVSEILGRN